MTDLIETEVRAAFAEQARLVPTDVGERLRGIDFHPRSRTLSPRLALGTGAGVAATAGIVVALVGLSTGAAPAFAGWSATPTQPTSGETTNALAHCASRLAGAGGSQSGIPTTGWQPVLTDTRGPFTAFVLESGSATATCLDGPSFTSIEANNDQGGASQHVLGSGAAAGSPPVVSVLGLGEPGSGPISQATQSQLATSGGEPYTLVQGQIEAGVTGLRLTLSDTSNVEATVADGAFIAWWPGSADATSAQATTTSGETTQQLNFTPVNPPHGAPTTGHNSSSSSRANPAQQAQLQAAVRKFSACMRSHGLPNFYPTPSSNGGYSTNSAASDLNPSSPMFQAAQRACASNLPAARAKTANGG